MTNNSKKHSIREVGCFRLARFMSMSALGVLPLLPASLFAKGEAYRDSKLAIEERVEDLLARMTLEEKVGQMSQFLGPESLPKAPVAGEPQDDASTPPFYDGLTKEIVLDKVRRGEIGSFLNFYKDSVIEGNELQSVALESRLGIPLLFGADAIHGHAMAVGTTVFPVPIGLAASFDEELMIKVAQVTAREMRATGFQWAFAPNIEVARDMRWGRVGETFGEDPLLVSRLGVAQVRGLQGNLSDPRSHVLACAKHFLGGSESVDGRNHGPADFSERTMREVFLPPFIDNIKAGVGTVMIAHNEINGVPNHANYHLMTEVLKGELGFKGFAVSDWLDVSRLWTVQHIASNMAEASELAVNAGLDMNMHGPGFFEAIVAAVKEGRIQESRIDQSVRRLLQAKFTIGLFEEPYADSSLRSRNLATQANTDAALEAARKSLVLLRNEASLLPLNKNIWKLFLSGPNADNTSALGDWSTIENADRLVTVKGGLERQLGVERLDYFDCGPYDQIGDEEITAAASRAKDAEVAVLVVGGHPLRGGGPGSTTEGENWDRAYFDLPGRQVDLVKAVQATGVPTVVILQNGGPVSIPWIKENVPAIIESFYPGQQGGTAVAEALFGDYNPSGRLPYSVPHDTAHHPAYYYQRPAYYSLRGKFSVVNKEYARTPQYPFGYGLSYTQFRYSNLSLPKAKRIGEPVEVSVVVENVGEHAGDEIVLAFVKDLVSSVTSPSKLLKEFRRISLSPGEAKTVTFVLPADAFGLFDVNLKRVIEPGVFSIMIGDQVAEIELAEY